MGIHIDLVVDVCDWESLDNVRPFMYKKAWERLDEIIRYYNGSYDDVAMYLFQALGKDEIHNQIHILDLQDFLMDNKSYQNMCEYFGIEY